jgi:hypothetical protein
MRHRWSDKQAAVIDEISLAVAEVYHAMCFRSAIARQQAMQLDVTRYMSTWCGNLPIGLHLGDFMQLRPAGRRSLCEWMQNASESDDVVIHGESTAAELGRYIFRDSITRVAHFSGTGRFSSCSHGQDLVCLLKHMRLATPMPDDLWARLQQQIVDPNCSTGNRMLQEPFINGHEGALQWEIVARLQQARAVRDARLARAKMYYSQAVDSTVK